MKITLHRYQIKGNTWKTEDLTTDFLKKVVNKMIIAPFMGNENEPDRQFGFAHCAFLDKIIYGIFVQKFPKTLKDYDVKTKQEKKQKSIDSGEYLFIIFPENNELYLQNKRDADLPCHVDIEKRFADLLKYIFYENSFTFSELIQTEDKINRDRIVEIFYKKADEILEMEFTDFDKNLIKKEKEKRHGKLQKYFNPKEEYQEAMEEAAILGAEHINTAKIKAKQGCDLKKDPITRAMLEGSRQPTKIVYKKESQVFTDSAIKKQKEVISIEGIGYDFDTNEQIKNILSKLPSFNVSQLSEVASQKVDDPEMLF